MTAPRLAFQDGKLILRDGKAGTGEGCCCGGDCCSVVTWTRFFGCDITPDREFVLAEVGADCYAYYTQEGWDCQAEGCEEEGQCNIYARVKVTGNTVGGVSYLQSGPGEEEVWGLTPPGGQCDCPGSLVSLAASCSCNIGYERRVEKQVEYYLDDPDASCPSGFAKVLVTSFPEPLYACEGFICLDSVTPEEWLNCDPFTSYYDPALPGFVYPNCPKYNCIYGVKCQEYADFINANGGSFNIEGDVVYGDFASRLHCCEVGVDCCDASVANPFP